MLQRQAALYAAFEIDLSFRQIRDVIRIGLSRSAIKTAGVVWLRRGIQIGERAGLIRKTYFLRWVPPILCCSCLIADIDFP
jgi:hypothetical protein